MDEIITLIQTLGLPIGLVLWYILYQKPRDDKRNNELVDKLMAAQKECAEKMGEALRSNVLAIRELTELIETKIK